MKELIHLILKFRIRTLLLEPTDNGVIKFLRYCFVGGIAFLVDYLVAALVFWLLGRNPISTVAGTTTGFLVGLIVNFILSKRFVFTEDAKRHSRNGEFLVYAVIGLVGLLISNLLMLIATSWLWSFNQFIAKIAVSAIVLVYNYLARKFVLYRS